jgi:hypothetical protein
VSSTVSHRERVLRFQARQRSDRRRHGSSARAMSALSRMAVLLASLVDVLSAPVVGEPEPRLVAP